MSPKRRFVLALGVVLLVGGWGAVQYTDARQEALREKDRERAWEGNKEFLSARIMYLSGVASMTVGAMCVVFIKA